MKKIFIAISLVLILAGAGCETTTETGSSNPKAYNVLEENGFTEIELTGTPLLGCGKDDSLLNSHEFTATNHLGKKVSGIVCCGWLKGCTIRF